VYKSYERKLSRDSQSTVATQHFEGQPRFLAGNFGLKHAADTVAELRREVRGISEETGTSISQFRVAVEAAHKGQRDLLRIRREKSQ